jgi:hypothetical protein
MTDNNKQQQLKKMGIIQGLNAIKQMEAERIIDMGADVNLIYFWYNLGKAYYYPNFSLDEVHKQALYYKGRYPSMEPAINEWVHCYEIRTNEMASDKAALENRRTTNR